MAHSGVLFWATARLQNVAGSRENFPFLSLSTGLLSNKITSNWNSGVWAKQQTCLVYSIFWLSAWPIDGPDVYDSVGLQTKQRWNTEPLQLEMRHTEVLELFDAEIKLE